MTFDVKMNLDQDDLSVYPLKILWYGRYHPALNPLWTTILVPLNIGVCSLFLALAVKGVLVSYNNDIFFTCECLQTCLLMIHAIGKFLTLHVYKPELYAILAKKSKFWKIKDFDGIVYEESYKTYKVANKIIHYYYYLIIALLIIFDLQPFLTGSLPTVCYVPKGWFKYLTVLMWYASCTVLTGLNGTDCLFCSLSISLFIQFRLLGHKFKRMAEPKNLEGELKKLIDFHNFLTNYCKELNSIFGGVFFLQFMESIACASVAVFIFTQPGVWANRIKFLLYFIAIIVETAFYCVPLELVVNAAADLGQSVYESKWYNVKNLHLRKSLTIVIAKSQKVVIFSAYGLIWMNLRTFVTICKTTFSFFTYLNSVNKIK